MSEDEDFDNGVKSIRKKRALAVFNDDSDDGAATSSSDSEESEALPSSKRKAAAKKPQPIAQTLPQVPAVSNGPRKFIFGNRAPRSMLLSKPFVSPLNAGSENSSQPTIQPASDSAETVSAPASPGGHENLIKMLLSKPFRVPTMSGVGSSSGNLGLHLGMRRPGQKRALHDPDVEGALILYSPPEVSSTEKLKLASDKIEVHVVVDPKLSDRLRPHQREGVKFMYECVTGIRIPGSYGCILADEMGLGKTLQVVTLLWTLLRQSPTGSPTVERACVVTPTALVRNWADEFDKWLGAGRCGALVLDGSLSKDDIDKRLVAFGAQMGSRRPTPVLIISYDTFRLHVDVIRNSAKVGIIVCDEGHRLKNADSQTYQALLSVGVQRRILLSGTPIQNDLTEYFSLVHFVNEGMLGTAAEFRKKFELPIIRSRERDGTDKDRQIGEERLLELLTTVNKCLLRRTQALLTRYLPIKYELLVCCRMTEEQRKVYVQLCAEARSSISSSVAIENNVGQRGCAFAAITQLKKLTCHPALAAITGGDDSDDEAIEDDENGKKKKSTKKKQAAASSKPVLDIKALRVELSGKLAVLDLLLAHVKSTTNDKVVLVSNYTQVIDIFESLCNMRGYGYIRLDGSMTAKSRGNAVARFNEVPVAKKTVAASHYSSSSHQSPFIFLLSSKAGGCGLNLIGANRLVMFDPDWNPANDDQAMARVWRDGQKKECFIYRFVATASIEEKIVQRQAHKRSLKTCVVDAESSERHFSSSELRDLFSFDDKTPSDTHERLRCKRCVNGCQAFPPTKNAETELAAAQGDLAAWFHEHAPGPGMNPQLAGRNLPDQILRQTWANLPNVISFVFHRKSHEEQIKVA